MLTYRKCVAILLKKNDKFFVGERADIQNAWQLPQGGVDEGETHLEAAKRELYEETGVTSIRLLGQTKHAYRYDFSAKSQARAILKYGGLKYIGQEQVFFVFEFFGDDSEINLETTVREFLRWKWTSLSEITEKIVAFKRSTYVNAIKELQEAGII